MIRRSVLVFTFAVVAVVAWPSLGLAQDGPAQFLWVGTDTVAPGMVAQYEEAARQTAEAYRQTGAGPQTVLIYQTLIGSNAGHRLSTQRRTYLAAIPFNAWSDIDGWQLPPQVLIQAHGPEAGAEISAQADAAVLTSEVSIGGTQFDFTSTSSRRRDGPSAFAQVITTQVDLALQEDYFLFLTKLKEAEVAAGISTTRRSTAQGPLNEFTAVRFFSNFAERDTWTNPYQLLTEHLGEAEAAPLIQRQLQAVIGRTVETIVYRPDLSILPGN